MGFLSVQGSGIEDVTSGCHNVLYSQTQTRTKEKTHTTRNFTHTYKKTHTYDETSKRTNKYKYTGTHTTGIEK